MVQIKRAEKMGFCFGVKHAIESCNKFVHKIKNDQNVYMVGMLVHNDHVVKKIEKIGIKTIKEEDILNNKIDLKKSDIVIIRAHGTTKTIYDKLQEKEVYIEDAACIFVKEIRKKLIEMQAKGDEIIFIGDKFHPEVIGILSFGKNIHIFENLEELIKSNLDNKKQYSLLTQTTLNKIKMDEIKKYLENSDLNVKIFNKICSATQERQEAVEKIAKEVEIMLIVGGKKSSNTKKLYEISKKNNSNTILLDNENDIEMSWFDGIKTIGISAGASTPEEIIKKIENKIRGKLMSNIDYNEFEALLNEYLPPEEKGKVKVLAKISQLDRNFAYLDAAGQPTAIRVRTEELDGYNLGDEIEVILIGESEDGEFLIGSRRRIDMEEGMKHIEKAFETKGILKCKIIKKINGGYILEFMKQQGFLPNSLSEISSKDSDSVIGTNLEVMVKDIKADKKGKRVTFSRKDITLLNSDKELANIKVGDIIDGEVGDILDFGLNVKCGNVRGFVHISEVSWKKIDTIKGMFTSGEKMQFKVLGIDTEKRNLKLSIKSLSKNPWVLLQETYKIGDEVEGKVTRTTPYGIFVEIIPGVEGLVHVSDFTWTKKKVTVSDYAKIGDTVKVLLMELDANGRKLKLGIKQLTQDPWAEATEKFKVGTKLQGKILEIKNFGLFVEVENQVDAFIHQSEINWPGDNTTNVKVGDVVEFIVLELNLEEKKIKGSIKALVKGPWEKALENYKIGDIVEKEIKTIMDFGMFVNLDKGVDGFIPMQLASKDFIKNLKDKFQVGDKVKAEVVEIDREKKKIKLSIKKLELDKAKKEEKELIEKYSVSQSK